MQEASSPTFSVLPLSYQYHHFPASIAAHVIVEKVNVTAMCTKDAISSQIKRKCKLEKEDVVTRLQSFHQFLRSSSRGTGLPQNRGMGRFHPHRFTNMDESPWAIDQRGQMTVEETGSKTVDVQPIFGANADKRIALYDELEGKDRKWD
jgi:hypothetical protein